MNASQMKYLFTELERIESSLKSTIEKEYPDSPTLEEKFSLIREGKVRLKSYEEVMKNCYNDPYLFKAYDFSGVEFCCRSAIRTEKRAALKERIQDLKNSVVFDGELKAQDVIASARCLTPKDL